MKRTILIIATVVFGLLNANATNLKTDGNSVTPVDITKKELVEVYDWTVVTTSGEFSGTAATLFEAKKRSNLVGQNEVVLERKITNYFVLKSEMFKKESRLYFWEVKSEKGYAKGFSSSEFSAKQMIHLVAKGDIMSYKIIASK
ncbi:hypothetical protein [Olleya aquimaris]|uniref:Uncharacterized protein n=1 Tax=Olleya aquimaris TaxID=639310 RepID=A0A327REE0_9FLAO|nr:hypothetical protein [Olleya aquimaris]RAJ15071.1 hypothetical protein LY08_01420 [Olleya aquimaris]